MPCYSGFDENGHRIFMCGNLGAHCNSESCGWFAEYLCDFPIDNGKTCDRQLCQDHAYEVAPDTHYCANHYNRWIEYRKCGGVSEQLKLV